jgi:hypothetical protein
MMCHQHGLEHPNLASREDKRKMMVELEKQAHLRKVRPRWGDASGIITPIHPGKPTTEVRGADCKRECNREI